MSNLHGEIVTWDMETTEARYADVVQALTDSGLDPDAATEMQPRAAFSRACKHLKEERTIDKLEASGGEASFQFTKKHLEGGKFEFDYECVLKLNLETGDVSCAENPDLALEAQGLIAHAKQTRNAQDITRLVQRLFKANAALFSINRKGVAYFVPETHREFTEKIASFLGRLGGRLDRFPVPKGDAAGDQSVRDAVQNGLQTMVDELNEVVASWDNDTRESTMEKTLERYRIISTKIDAYACHLGGQQAKLEQSLEDAKAELRRRMNELKPAEKAESNTAA